MSQDSQISFHSCILDISGLQHGYLQPPCSNRNIPDAILASSHSLRSLKIYIVITRIGLAFIGRTARSVPRSRSVL